MASGLPNVPGKIHPHFKNIGFGEFRVLGKLGQSEFRRVPGSDRIFCAVPWPWFKPSDTIEKFSIDQIYTLNKIKDDVNIP